MVGVVALWLAMVAAACGGGEDTPTPPPTVALPASTTAPAPTASPTARPPEPTPSPTPAPPQPERVTSDITNFLLEDLVVTVGTEVTWVNRDPTRHTTTSGSRDNQTGIWDSDRFAEGESFSFTFNQVGVFPYYCTIHRTFMAGTVTVIAPGQPTPTATATPEPTSTPVPTSAPPTSTSTAAPAPTSTATTDASNAAACGPRGDGSGPAAYESAPAAYTHADFHRHTGALALSHVNPDGPAHHRRDCGIRALRRNRPGRHDGQVGEPGPGLSYGHVGAARQYVSQMG